MSINLKHLISQITAVAGGDSESRLQSSTRPTHTWSRRAFRYRDTSPQDISTPCTLRSIMTTDNISSQHLSLRLGVDEANTNNSTSYVIYRPTTNLIKRGTPYIIAVCGTSDDELDGDIEIGFLPSHDYGKDDRIKTQLDEFCLRPIELSAINKHRFAFRLENKEVKSLLTPDGSNPNVEVSRPDIKIKSGSILSVKITETNYIEAGFQ